MQQTLNNATTQQRNNATTQQPPFVCLLVLSHLPQINNVVTTWHVSRIFKINKCNVIVAVH
jgi:hypothetical protein